MSRPPLARPGPAALAAALAVVLAATAFGTPVSAVPATSAETAVEGTLTGADGRPAAFAQVSVHGTDTDYVADALTDAAGRFTVADAQPGDVKVRFQAGGLVQWAHQQTDYDKATTFTVRSGQTLVVDEQMSATGTISGRFTEPDGSAPGFTVVYAQDADSFTTVYGVTDDDGRYSLDVLPGRYRVAFELGSGTQYAHQATSAQRADTFTVDSGAVVRVDDSRLRTGSLGGRLTTAAGEPAPDAQVTLQTSDTFAGSTTTDADGRYSFTGVLPDDYQVSFTAGQSTQWAYGAVDRAGAATIPVSPGKHSTVDEKLLSAGTLTGRFTATDGRGLEGWQVRAEPEPQGDSMGYSAITDANGEWTVPHAYRGDYVVSFHDPQTGRPQFAYGKGNRKDAARITVAADTTTRVDDTAVAAAQLAVTAKDATSGAAVSAFCVYAAGPTDGQGCTTTGTVTLSDLPAGDFSVSVTAEGDSFYLPGGATVTTVAGQTLAVGVPLTLGGRISTTATARVTGTPVADACINPRVPRTGGLDQEGGSCTDATGAVRSEALAPGTYQVFAYAPRGSGLGHQWVGRTGGTGDQRAAATVTVRPGTVTKAPAIRLDRAGTITGTVTDDQGEPVTDGIVAYSAWGFGSGETHEVPTDDKGRYTMTVLGPYAWPLAFTTGGWYREWSGHTSRRFAAHRIPVRSGASTTYDMRLRTGSTLTGRVTIDGGASGGRIVAVDPVTGDTITASDLTADDTYALRLPGGDPIKIRYYLWGAARSSGGWYDNVTEMAQARSVSVPQSGTRTFNFSIR